MGDKLYFVVYKEPRGYLVLHCIESKKQAECMLEIYKTNNNKARIAEVYGSNTYSDYLDFDDDLWKVYIFSDRTHKTELMGVDQMLSYKGYDTRRLFSIVTWGGDDYRIFVHAKDRKEAVEKSRKLFTLIKINPKEVWKYGND